MITSGKSLLHLGSIIGQLIGGKYRVEQQLGLGSLSAVYRAQRLIDVAPVTITMFLLPKGFSQDETSRFMSRFSQEATALIKLSHPSILPIYDYGEHEGYPYLVSGYVEGGSLADMLKARGRYTMQEALFILENVASALDYAHQHGVTHRALKPANILFGNDQLSLAGFGLVRMVEMAGLNQESPPPHQFLSIAGTYIGSPEYMAPEWVIGQPVGASADIYALGVILFEMLTGSPPFTGDNFLQIVYSPLLQPFPSVSRSSGLPSTLDSVFDRATCVLPELRFERAGDMVEVYITAAGLHRTHAYQNQIGEVQNTGPLTEPSMLTMRAQRLTDPLVELVKPPIEANHIEVPERAPHRTVDLTELRLAPWLAAGAPDQEASLYNNEAGSPGDIAEEIKRLLESALTAQTPSRRDAPIAPLSQFPTELAVALAQTTPATGRKFATTLSVISIKTIVGTLSQLFRGGANDKPQTPHQFVCHQTFSAICENFPARTGAFAPRRDTFPSSRSDEGSVKSTAVAALSAPLPHPASGTL
jgi:serine/threonine protein kinase